ncbi:hypothetical protein KAR91_35715 [Candidatus Pacearchaeota archaeon]|nr:hypothetical protein [Candidatus Pacearchaeota archaeon]
MNNICMPSKYDDIAIIGVLLLCALFAQTIGANILIRPFDILEDVSVLDKNFDLDKNFASYTLAHSIIEICSWLAYFILAVPFIWVLCDLVIPSIEIIYHAIVETAKWFIDTFAKLNDRRNNNFNFDQFSNLKNRVLRIWKGKVNLSSYHRRIRCQNALLLLALLDTVLIAIAMVVTGCTTQSIYSPVFMLILVTIVIMQLPQKAFILTFLFQLLLWICISTFEGHFDMTQFSEDGIIYFSQGNDAAPQATLAIFGMSLAMMGMQCFLTQYNNRYLKPQDKACLLWHKNETFTGHIREHFTRYSFWDETCFKNHVTWNRKIKKRLKTAGRDWATFLTHHGIVPKEMSRVHDPQTIYTHAVILSLPYWEYEFSKNFLARFLRCLSKKDMVYRITFLTFASHWIDDYFDDLQERSTEEKEVILKTEGNYAKILEAFPRINTVIKKMKRIVPKKNRSQVDRAMERIIRGAFIQNSDVQKQLIEHINHYKDLVNMGLETSLQNEINRIHKDNHKTMWTTSKVVMELFHSCCGLTFNQNIAETYTALYAAFLYYQDIKNEKEEEGFGRAFSCHPHRDLPTKSDMERLIKMYIKYVHKNKEIDRLHSHRMRQLHSLLWIYEEYLPPEIADTYHKILLSA